MKNVGLAEVLKINVKPILHSFEKLIGPSSKWNRLFNKSNWSKYTNLGNQHVKSPIFKKKYRDILRVASQHMGLSDFYHQAQPTFRIQLPGSKSVTFHNDYLISGHGKNILNFWFPLTNVNQENCLYLLEDKQSKMLLKKFKSEQLSLNLLDSIAREKSKPALIRKNEMLCFSNKVLHGTVHNNSDQVRVSLDFRCLPIDEDPGTRVLDVEYIKLSQPKKKLLTQCVSVVFQSGDVKHIGHNAQRAVINDYAIKHGFSIIKETSEWHHLDFYPEILDILESHPNTPILIFSKSSFNLKSKAWKSLAIKLKKHGGRIYFCLENEIF